MWRFRSVAWLGLFAGLVSSVAAPWPIQVHDSMDEIVILLEKDLKDGHRALLFSRKRPLVIERCGESRTIPGLFLWLEIRDDHLGEAYPVWREWFVVRREAQRCLGNFVLMQKDTRSIALACVEGWNIRFWEITLGRRVSVDAEATTRYANSVAVIGPVCNTPTQIPVRQLLGAATSAVPAKKLAIEWKDDAWEVWAKLEDSEVVFRRTPSEAQWRIHAESHSEDRSQEGKR